MEGIMLIVPSLRQRGEYFPILSIGQYVQKVNDIASLYDCQIISTQSISHHQSLQEFLLKYENSSMDLYQYMDIILSDACIL